MSKNLRAINARRAASPGTLFERLTGGGAPADDAVLAEASGLSPATVLGVRSFYDFLSAPELDRRVRVCNGVACLSAGTTVLPADLATATAGRVRCIGRCYHGGGYQIEGRSYDREGSDSAIPYACIASSSIFPEPNPQLDAFYARLAEGDVLSELEAAGLRGRGGAGFPFAIKLKACAEAAGDPKYIVCNADEGDPGAFSDRWLLEQRPHLVLGGMLAAGLACGARVGYLYVRAEYPEAIERLESAVETFHATAAARAADFCFRIVRGAGSYVCGEETALLNSIEGLRPEVRVRPPYPAQEGLFGKPTLLSNVETFAAVPWILRRGGPAFAALGRGRSTGTKLVCLDHNFSRPGVYEVEMGLPLRDLIHWAGGFRRPVKALQVGGPLGGVLPVAKIDDLTLDFESFEAAGFLLGHAGIVAIPADFPMIELLCHLFEYMAEESCGKCVPCRMGTRKGAQMLRAATPESPLRHEDFEALLETLEIGSLCALGGGLPLPARNILEHFKDEVGGFFRG